jgi:hypothetical protein
MSFQNLAGRCLALAAFAVFGFGPPAQAQTHHHHPMPAAPDTTAARDSTASHHPPAAPKHDMRSMEHMVSMQHMEHMHHAMDMGALYGPYPMTREASGTAWQPDLARHGGVHLMKGSWMLMFHGAADLVYDHQGGPRGNSRVFSSNMAMGMAQRPLGPGILGFRAMLSAEPVTIGKKGYPLLLQTGETADGVTHLIDRQHPHDLFMELAGTYSISGGNRSVFLYAGLPGEPALGPPAFMHRFSGMALPEAPITHHWLESSHITFGVLTAGVVQGGLKLEASAFRGREPDEKRFDIESPKLDSHSFRLSWNPRPAWALQMSRGRLDSPEQLEPSIDTDRTTASVMHAAEWTGGHWESSLAWGRNRKRPGPTSDAFALESAVELRQKHNLFARVERVEKDELFPGGDPREGQSFWVGKGSAGYRMDFHRPGKPTLGVGVLGSLIGVPRELRDVYGKGPAAVMLFARAAL